MLSESGVIKRGVSLLVTYVVSSLYFSSLYFRACILKPVFSKPVHCKPAYWNTYISRLYISGLYAMCYEKHEPEDIYMIEFTGRFIHVSETRNLLGFCTIREGREEAEEGYGHRNYVYENKDVG